MRNKEKAKLIVALLFLSGCATDRPHNDVLIFGTTTKVALDVAAPVQNAGVPEFTLGYKRSEAVWMPLRPNGDIVLDGKPDTAIEKAKIAAIAANECMTLTPGFSQAAREQFCLNLVAPTNKYLGKANGIIPTKGGTIREEDTYSVFASFGGSGNLSFSGASGNLAQFFATGIAAQRLGANPSVGVALNAGSEAAMAIEASANAEIAKANVEEAKVSAFAEGGKRVFSKKTAEADFILACHAPETDQAVYKKFVQTVAQKNSGILQQRLLAVEAIEKNVVLYEDLVRRDDVRKALFDSCVAGG